MEVLGSVIYFESDDEFTDFCLAPYGVIVYEGGTPTTWTGVYSDQYKEAIVKGMTFVIKDEDSTVFRRQCVTKRVPIQGTRREALVQMPVENLEEYFEDF